MAETPRLSVVVPVHDEAGNVGPLVREVVVGGRRVVGDGRHLASEAIARRYRDCVRRLEAAMRDSSA